MRTSEVLNKAADLIQERGWVVGPAGWSDAAGQLCLEGAIYLAGGCIGTVESDEANLCPSGQAVRAYLEMGDYSCATPLYDWNDAQSDSGAVIEVLRAAAVIEAAREEQDAAYATYEQNVVSA